MSAREHVLEVIVEPRNAATGQAPFQVADDPYSGRWYRFELSDGTVVFVNAHAASFPWVDHQPPLDLHWDPVRVVKRPA